MFLIYTRNKIFLVKCKLPSQQKKLQFTQFRKKTALYVFFTILGSSPGGGGGGGVWGVLGDHMVFRGEQSGLTKLKEGIIEN